MKRILERYFYCLLCLIFCALPPFQWNIPPALDTQMKAVQTFYADQMEAHGDRKTFNLETNANGTVIVHPVTGQFTDTYYQDGTLDKVNDEVKQRFGESQDIYIIVVDISTERIDGICGIAYFETGPAVVPASGDCVYSEEGKRLIAHELGHAFNLEHDFRDDAYIMSYGAARASLSECAASQLTVNPFFQTNFVNTTDSVSTIQIHSPTTYSEDIVDWTLQFSISDPDGIHQAQFLVYSPNESPSIVSCRSFSSTQSATVEFAMPEGSALLPTNNVLLRVVDKNGNVERGDWTLIESGTTATTETTETATYLTLSHDSPDALMPTNNSSEWAGWDGLTWERRPGSGIPRRPQGFMSPDPHIPYILSDWDYWFYAHAESRLIYDLSGGTYTEFQTYFDMPNPCGTIASVVLTCLADGTEIYNSGVLRTTRNTYVSFDIPENTETLTIHVSDGGDRDTCDHFILAEARLLHTEPMAVIPIVSTQDNTDVNRDGVVNLVDLVIVASRYGERNNR